MKEKKFAKLDHSHHPMDIRQRIKDANHANYLKDLIYGGVDGTITTFAIVSGVAGAKLDPNIVVILGMANVLADGFSMAASNYLGQKAEKDHSQLLEKFERQQIQKNPVGEKEEVRQILTLKGFSGDTLENATNVFVADEDKWVNFMLHEEYGISKNHQSPLKAAFATFFSFCFFGMFPVLPYLLPIENRYMISCILTSLCFFGIGSFKSKWSLIPWWKSGFQTFLLGAIAASLAFYIGYALENLR